MNDLEPILLQRLVDGELDLPEIQRLLTEAEDHPDWWRQIATAMIEDRLWNQASNRLASETVVSAPPDHPVGPSVVAAPSTHGRYGSIHWFSIAASLLLAAMLGYSFNSWVPAKNRGQLASIDPAPDRQPDVFKNDDPLTDPLQQPVEIPKATQVAYQPDYHLELPEDSPILNRNTAADVDPVPLYRVENRDQWQRYQEVRQAGVSPELMKRFAAAGYQVQQDIEFISGSVDDQQTFVVPVRTIRFVPRQ